MIKDQIAKTVNDIENLNKQLDRLRKIENKYPEALFIKNKIYYHFNDDQVYDYVNGTQYYNHATIQLALFDGELKEYIYSASFGVQGEVDIITTNAYSITTQQDEITILDYSEYAITEHTNKLIEKWIINYLLKSKTQLSKDSFNYEYFQSLLNLS